MFSSKTYRQHTDHTNKRLKKCDQKLRMLVTFTDRLLIGFYIIFFSMMDDEKTKPFEVINNVKNNVHNSV